MSAQTAGPGPDGVPPHHRRHHGPRALYLDEVTLTLINQYLQERHAVAGDRKHALFISQQTAAETAPVNELYLRLIFQPLGVNHTQLRRDRILDEARRTADPVHLMRVFGITDGTAMNYIYAARPDKRPARLR